MKDDHRRARAAVKWTWAVPKSRGVRVTRYCVPKGLKGSHSSVKNAGMSSVVQKEIDIWIRDIHERMRELERERADAYKLLERYERKVCRRERSIIRKIQRHRMRFY